MCEITDGPFAVTKEVLAGYFLLECADLDEALTQAARLPIARYGLNRCTTDRRGKSPAGHPAAVNELRPDPPRRSRARSGPNARPFWPP